MNEEAEKEFVEKVVKINRVSKVVKGGRRFSFNALAVVGDLTGRVGIGLGKANEVPDAIRKAIETARRNFKMVSITQKNTIPHDVVGRYKSTRVMLRPATPGTGIIAGEAVRAVVEQAGVHDILSKVDGSKNPINVVRATLDALTQLETPSVAARKRNITYARLFGHE
ncbi:MAG: 30S ribosomal protein S5 [Candidatus Aminicenantes bacterium]|nr:30S ribosomal protein S5 [Candidatus Aminicenantes bacterium]